MTGLVSWAADINVNSISDFHYNLVDGNKYILQTDLVLDDTRYVSGGTVTIDLNGHVLDRNLSVATSSGCCLYIDSSGTLTIMDSNPSSVHTGDLAAYTGGIITGGYNIGAGGGIFLYSGTLYLQGGTIAGNRSAYNGGGVSTYGTMRMTGGKICNNITRDYETGIGWGGGVCAYSAFIMTGGEISGNTGGGVYSLGSNVSIGNTAKIFGNTLADGTTTQNLFIGSNLLVYITEPLESGANIWVTLESGTGTITSGYATHNSGVDPNLFFTSDKPIYDVSLMGGGQVQLVGYTTLSANPVDGHYWATHYISGTNRVADANTTVYAVTRDGSTLTLVEVPNRVVKADEGVVLMSTEQTITLTNTTTAPTSGTYTGNVLSGVDAVAAQASGYTYYVLSCENSTLGFYKYNSGNTLGAHKAYLAVPAADARGFFLFGDDATGVQELENTEVADMESCYNLLGSKVVKPNRGLYILNGKKVIIK